MSINGFSDFEFKKMLEEIFSPTPSKKRDRNRILQLSMRKGCDFLFFLFLHKGVDERVA